MKTTMVVQFQRGRQGDPVAFDKGGKVLLPDRRGAKPEVGEWWEVVVERDLDRCTIVRCVRRVEETWEFVPIGPSVLGERRVQVEGRRGDENLPEHCAPREMRERVRKHNEEAFGNAVERAVEVLKSFLDTLDLGWKFEVEPVPVDQEGLRGELRAISFNRALRKWEFWSEGEKLLSFEAQAFPGMSFCEVHTYRKIVSGSLRDFEEVYRALGEPAEIAEDSRHPFQLVWKAGDWTVCASVYSAAAFPERELVDWYWNGGSLVGRFRVSIPGIASGDVPVLEWTLGCAERVDRGQLNPAAVTRDCPPELRAEVNERLRATIRPFEERVWEVRFEFLGQQSKKLAEVLERAYLLASAKRVEKSSRSWTGTVGYVPLSPDERRGGYYSNATVQKRSQSLVLDGWRIRWPGGGDSAEATRRKTLASDLQQASEIRERLGSLLEAEVAYRDQPGGDVYADLAFGVSEAEERELDCLLFLERTDRLIELVQAEAEVCFERTDPDKLRPLAQAALEAAKVRAVPPVAPQPVRPEAQVEPSAADAGSAKPVEEVNEPSEPATLAELMAKFNQRD